MTAAERAAAELEDFARQSHADVDPHAPPAVKSSPSVSGEDHGESWPSPHRMIHVMQFLGLDLAYVILFSVHTIAHAAPERACLGLWALIPHGFCWSAERALTVQ